MGTWGPGAFENDSAADWAWLVDDAVGDDRIEVVRKALTRAADNDGYLKYDDAVSAVAAAAIVSSQIPGGFSGGAPYAPTCLQDGTMPALPVELRELAVRALDRVTGENSAWRLVWSEVDSTDAFAEVGRIRDSLVTGSR